jgi:hypothetical protein
LSNASAKQQPQKLCLYTHQHERGNAGTRNEIQFIVVS